MRAAVAAPVALSTLSPIGDSDRETGYTPGQGHFFKIANPKDRTRSLHENTRSFARVCGIASHEHQS